MTIEHQLAAFEFFLEGLKGNKLLKAKPKDYGLVVLGNWPRKYRVLKERKKVRRSI